MGKLIYLVNISLDGYIADREGNVDFNVPNRDWFSAILETVRPAGTYLYGRRMYETMAVWETAHLEPNMPAFIPGLGDLEREFAAVWRGAEKVVFTTTLPSVSTPHTRIERDLGALAQVKASSARDLTVGGAQLAGAALAANLVDEIHAMVCPIILGGGTPWLPQNVRTPLTLVGERRFGEVVHIHYRPR